MNKEALTTADLAWAAGFLEGEGSFRRSEVSCPQVQKEPLEKLQSLFGGTISLRVNSSIKSAWSDCWIWSLAGEPARWLMSILSGFMSAKRQAQIAKAIESYLGAYCKNGHLRRGDNAQLNTNGYFACRTCMRDSQRKYYLAHDGLNRVHRV